METIQNNGLHWFAVHVRSRHEFRVFDRLTQAGIEAFLPAVERLSRWKDRKNSLTSHSSLVISLSASQRTTVFTGGITEGLARNSPLRSFKSLMTST